jgi:hypothetical protein
MVASDMMPVLLLLLWALQPAERACARGKGRLETTTSRSLRLCTWWTLPSCSQLLALTYVLLCLQEAYICIYRDESRVAICAVVVSLGDLPPEDSWFYCRISVVLR